MIAWMAFSLAPLFVQLLLLSLLGGAVNRSAYRLCGKTTYLLMMWPGVIVHELSHLAGCILTRTRVRRVHLFAPHEEGGGITLGSVEHDLPRSVVARAIISGAPFFGGAAAIMVLTRIFLPAASRIAFAPVIVASPDLSALLSAFARALEGYAASALAVGAALDWTSWKSYAFLYAIFSLASHVAPSRTDLKNAAGGAAFLVALVFAFAWSAERLAMPAAFALAAWTSSVAAILTSILNYGLATLCVAGLFLVLASLVVSLLSGRSRRAG